MGKVKSSLVPAIATIIILRAVIPKPPNAVPMVNLDTHDSER